MKKILYTLLSLALLVPFSSCQDWLSVLPENEQVSDEYWTSKEEVESVLAAGYVYLRDAVPQLIKWGELRGGCIYSQYGSNLQRFQISPDTSGDCSWASLYKVINMANAVIANAPTVLERDETFEESVMNSYMTEAYFLRALSYFYLVRNWRDAPLILDPYENDAISYEKAASSEDEIIEQIKADLLSALGTGAAKEKYEDDWATKGRATKWAIYALMADVCLWNEDYTDAIIYCNNILDATSSFRPEFVSDPTQWYEIYYPGNSNGSIFELNWDYSTYNQSNDLPSLFGTSSPTYYYTDQMTEDFIEETFEAGIDNTVRDLYGGLMVDAVSSNSITTTYGYIWKYSGIGITSQVRSSAEQDPNFIIYRTAEVMLMKAEALVLSSTSEESWQTAVDLINEIRVRSNLEEITPVLAEVSQADLLEYILTERKMELAAEGKRWYDVLRLGKIDNYKYRSQFLIEEVVKYNNTANSSWIRSVLSDDDALYLPIWSTELENNKLLVQNPYYAVN